MFLLMGGRNPEDSKPCSPLIFIVLWGILIICLMTISCWRWLKTAINRGNLWSTAPQSKADDDDDDDELTGPTQGSLSHIDSLDILIHLTCCQD